MRNAVLVTEGWGGRITSPVVVVGETPKRFRIMAPPGRLVRLGGRGRWLSRDEIVLVPKHAVRFEDSDGMSVHESSTDTLS